MSSVRICNFQGRMWLCSLSFTLLMWFLSLIDVHNFEAYIREDSNNHNVKRLYCVYYESKMYCTVNKKTKDKDMRHKIFNIVQLDDRNTYVHRVVD